MEKPNYDIYVEEENCLYKETPEDDIIELVKENKQKYIEKVKEHIEFLKKSKENESFLWLYENELEKVIEEKNMQKDFNDIKSEYNELREQERVKIIEYFISKGFDVSKAGGKGREDYTNGGRIKPYDLSNWKWVEFKVDNKIVFISLQAFDQDKSSKNFHVLMDRIGICVIDSDNKDYFNTMETTEYDLPLLNSDLDNLYKIINKKIKE